LPQMKMCFSNLGMGSREGILDLMNDCRYPFAPIRSLVAIRCAGAIR
jgi:hypothetical protein